MTTSQLTRAGLASRRWRPLVPIAFTTYSLAYLDRSNYSSAPPEPRPSTHRSRR